MDQDDLKIVEKSSIKKVVTKERTCCNKFLHFGEKPGIYSRAEGMNLSRARDRVYRMKKGITLVEPSYKENLYGDLTIALSSVRIDNIK